MHESTRMKKYESLRQSINEKTNEVIESPKLSRFAKRLNNIDATYFQPIVDQLKENPVDSTLLQTVPTRAKKEESDKSVLPNENESFFNEEEILARALRLSNQKEASSDDDMLNQFLKEIRTYNMKQGVRSQEDTRLEILKQVRVEMDEESDRSERFLQNKQTNQTNSKKVESPSDTVQRLNIARQVKDMIQNARNDENETSEISRSQRSYQESMDEDRLHRQRLLEETQQLRLQLSEHEEELDEIGTGIDYTRKLLNLLVALLLVTVLIAGAILGYLILNQ